jgi:HK97 gp10 family phage protein
VTVTISVTFDKFPQIAAAMPEKTSQVVRKAAFDIEGQAKNRAPVDTGALKNSISTEFEDNGLTGIIAPHVEYATFVEFGTKRMSAQPYMTPAAEAVAPAFISAMKQMLQELG